MEPDPDGHGQAIRRYVWAEGATVRGWARPTELGRDAPGRKESGPGRQGAEELGQIRSMQGNGVECHEHGGRRLRGEDSGLVGAVERDGRRVALVRRTSEPELLRSAAPASPEDPTNPVMAPTTPSPDRRRNCRRSRLIAAIPPQA